MAKIYETAADVDREKLNRQIRNAHQEQRYDAMTGVASALVATSSLTEKELYALKDLQDPKRALGFLDKFHRTFNKVAVYLGIAGAAVALYSYFSAGKKATEAKAKLDVLGPETVVYPENYQHEADGAASHHADRFKQEVAKSGLRSL